jgi:DNA repair protein RecN (Recombination protein N)
MLQQAGQCLVDILGQHQQQTLLQREQQLALLDSFGKLTEERAALQRAYRHYHALERDYRRIRQEAQERQQHLELLQFQLQEIAQARLQEGEEERLLQERHLLLNAERLYALSQDAYAALYRDETSALTTLAAALEKLTQLAGLDASQQHLQADLQQSYYLIEEVARSLLAYGEHMDVDPARLQAVEDRLAEIARLQRKYGPTIPAILQYHDKLQREQRDWERHGEHLAALRRIWDARARRSSPSLLPCQTGVVRPRNASSRRCNMNCKNYIWPTRCSR